MLSWMLVWMTQNAKSLKGEIEQTLSRNLDRAPVDSVPDLTLQITSPPTTPPNTTPPAIPASGQGSGAWAVFSLVLIAVVREGIEVVVFLGAQLQAGGLPILGAMLGLLGAVGIGVALFRFGVKLNLRLFFQVLGGFLLLIVAGLWLSVLSHGDKAALIWQQLTGQSWCWSATATTCILGPQIWNLHQILPDKGFPGIILKALLGYRDQLYALQGATYLGFLVIAVWRYRQALAPAHNSPNSSPEKS
jgi:high-affinity iron transporter